MSTHTATSDADLRVNGIEALNRKLGHTGALRFLALIGRGPTDYVQISRRLYKGQTINGVFARAKANWKQLRRQV